MLFEIIALYRAIKKQKKAIKHTKTLISMYDDRDMLSRIKPLKHVLYDQELVLIYLETEMEVITSGRF